MTVVAVIPPGQPDWAKSATRLLRRPTARLGAGIVAIFLLLTVLAPLLAPYSPFDQDFAEALQAPSAVHPFGTDQYGRDILSRVMYGTRIALLSILVADGFGLVVGTLLGLIAGYYGGWIDSAVMRIVDVLLAFPYLLLALIIVAALGPGLSSRRRRSAPIGYASCCATSCPTASRRC